MPKQPTEARQDELAIREKIAQFASDNIALYDCQDGCPDEVAIYELEHEGETIRTAEYCNKCFATRLFSQTVSSGGGVCKECYGQGEITGVDVGYPSIMSFAHCEHCHGTGKQPVETKTLWEWAEVGMKLYTGK